MNATPAACELHGIVSSECAAAFAGQCSGATQQYDPVSGGSVFRSILLDARSPCFNWYRDVLARNDATAAARTGLRDAILSYCSSPDGARSEECACMNFKSVYADYCTQNECSHAPASSVEGEQPCWVSQLYFHNACGGNSSGTDANGIPCNAAGVSQSIVHFLDCARGGSGHASHHSSHSSTQVKGLAGLLGNDNDCRSMCNPHWCWYSPCLGSTFDTLLTPDAYDYLKDGECATVCFQSEANSTIVVGSKPLPDQVWRVGQNTVSCGNTSNAAQLVVASAASSPSSSSSSSASSSLVVKWSKRGFMEFQFTVANVGALPANWQATLEGLPGFIHVYAEGAATQGIAPPGVAFPMFFAADQEAIDALDDNVALSGTLTLTYAKDPTVQPVPADGLATLTVPVTIEVLAQQPYKVTVNYVTPATVTRNIWMWGGIIIGALALIFVLLFLMWRKGLFRAHRHDKSRGFSDNVASEDAQGEPETSPDSDADADDSPAATAATQEPSSAPQQAAPADPSSVKDVPQATTPPRTTPQPPAAQSNSARLFTSALMPAPARSVAASRSSNDLPPEIAAALMPAPARSVAASRSSNDLPPEIAAALMPHRRNHGQRPAAATTSAVSASETSQQQPGLTSERPPDISRELLPQPQEPKHLTQHAKDIPAIARGLLPRPAGLAEPPASSRLTGRLPQNQLMPHR
jgi:hypothetical protein